MTQLSIIGAPTSAASFAPGQELAPAALRNAQLLTALRRRGFTVHDAGDLPLVRWQPDRAHRSAQNLPSVIDAVTETAARVAAAVTAGHRTMVIGGNCTLALGAVAGHQVSQQRVGLLYVDLHTDLNTPSSTSDGALDWMGVAHLLGLEGSLPSLASCVGRSPLLRPDDLVFLGTDLNSGTDWERDQLTALQLRHLDWQTVAADPEAAARQALAWLNMHDRLLVHLDVDVIDFIDLPLSENTSRNLGLTLDQTSRLLTVLCGDPRFAGITIAEINPLHGAEDGSTLRSFVEALADALAPAALTPGPTAVSRGHVR